jgi:hypothetical protein
MLFCDKRGENMAISDLPLAERERIWELFFGKRWSLTHIGKEYGLPGRDIGAVINSESEKRWREQHPHETNRKSLVM